METTEYVLSSYCETTVVSNEAFFVVAYEKEGTVEPLGPFRSTERRLVFRNIGKYEKIEIDHTGQVWVDQVVMPGPQEIADPVPHELHMEGSGETFRQELMRYVVDEVRRQVSGSSDEPLETFEEANDFDSDDDDEIRTPYELTEMQDEYYAEDQEARAGNHLPPEDQPAQGNEEGDRPGGPPPQSEPRPESPSPGTPPS